ncbi:adenosylcobinamide amidohydrolase [Sphaerimonospora thailandensis]|nr:adenosylcobinamide amidohydrolase [Sphaerimonospora thailandensis]
MEDGMRMGTILWRFGPGWRMISSAMLGGGIGPREWVLNAQVGKDYARMDPVEHLIEMGPEGSGVGMLTAAMVEHRTWAADGGVEALATVGLGTPTWAAASSDAATDAATYAASDAIAVRPGTINIIVAVPVALCDAALVNAVMTVTEAKTQALIEVGFPCTGTASDAVCVAVREEGPQELFGGPRSEWGARIARAVHHAVADGAHDWRRRAAARSPVVPH